MPLKTFSSKFDLLFGENMRVRRSVFVYFKFEFERVNFSPSFFFLDSMENSFRVNFFSTETTNFRENGAGITLSAIIVTIYFRGLTFHENKNVRAAEKEHKIPSNQNLPNFGIIIGASCIRKISRFNLLIKHFYDSERNLLDVSLLGRLRLLLNYWQTFKIGF